MKVSWKSSRTKSKKNPATASVVLQTSTAAQAQFASMSMEVSNFSTTASISACCVQLNVFPVLVNALLLLVVGTCLFAYGRRAGELCRRDSDCESGLLCAEPESGVVARVCRPPIRQDKQYSELCTMSSECDISRGLCCQLQRRHRQAPRKVSS